MIVSAVFLRGVGIVGHRKPKNPEENLEATAIDEKAIPRASNIDRRAEVYDGSSYIKEQALS